MDDMVLVKLLEQEAASWDLRICPGARHPDAVNRNAHAKRRADLLRSAAATITAWNTRAASGGDSASLEQRGRAGVSLASLASIEALIVDAYRDGMQMRSFDMVAARNAIAAALANQQGVGGQVGTFFAADPALGEFNNHPTLDAARADARKMLDYASDDAADSGWADDPPQICYGVVLGHCVEVTDSRRPAPKGSDFTELVEFELAATQPAGDVGSGRE